MEKSGNVQWKHINLLNNNDKLDIFLLFKKFRFSFVGFEKSIFSCSFTSWELKQKKIAGVKYNEFIWRFRYIKLLIMMAIKLPVASHSQHFFRIFFMFSSLTFCLPEAVFMENIFFSKGTYYIYIKTNKFPLKLIIMLHDKDSFFSIHFCFS